MECDQGSRTFMLTGTDATLDTCSESCRTDDQCVAYSAMFGSWCSGCREMLSRSHPGALSYKKDTTDTTKVTYTTTDIMVWEGYQIFKVDYDPGNSLQGAVAACEGARFGAMPLGNYPSGHAVNTCGGTVLQVFSVPSSNGDDDSWYAHKDDLGSVWSDVILVGNIGPNDQSCGQGEAHFVGQCGGWCPIDGQYLCSGGNCQIVCAVQEPLPEPTTTWRIGVSHPAQSCDQVCDANGDECDKAALMDMNGKAGAYVKARFALAGLNCREIENQCEKDSKAACVKWGSPYIRNDQFDEGKCNYGSVPSVAECSQIPEDHNNRRLCPCAKKEASAETATIVTDAKNNNKQCKSGGQHRVFDLTGQNATSDKCSQKCLDTAYCVTFSAVFGSWCVGCSVPLDEYHEGALAYVKMQDGTSTTTTTTTTTTTSLAGTYQLVGNGWCLTAGGVRINDPGISWKGATVSDDGSAQSCVMDCDSEPTCLGYMTEDGSKCDIILNDDTNAENGIQAADSETRNYCYKKQTATTTTTTTTAGTYQLVGNGWCLTAGGVRINDPGISWKGATVSDDGSAQSCVMDCDSEPTCLGYMTEDGSKCDIILNDDTNAENGIQAADSETRNYCYKKQTATTTTTTVDPGQSGTGFTTATTTTQACPLPQLGQEGTGDDVGDENGYDVSSVDECMGLCTIRDDCMAISANVPKPDTWPSNCWLKASIGKQAATSSHTATQYHQKRCKQTLNYTYKSNMNCRTAKEASQEAASMTREETIESCAVRCDKLPHCTGFMLGVEGETAEGPATGTCFPKQNIVLSKCDAEDMYDMYIKVAPNDNTFQAATNAVLVIYDQRGEEKQTMQFDKITSRFTAKGGDYYLQFANPSLAGDFLSGSLSTSVHMVQGGDSWSNNGGMTLEPDGDIAKSDGDVPYSEDEARWALRSQNQQATTASATSATEVSYTSVGNGACMACANTDSRTCFFEQAQYTAAELGTTLADCKGACNTYEKCVGFVHDVSAGQFPCVILFKDGTMPSQISRSNTAWSATGDIIRSENKGSGTCYKRSEAT
eukprot:TRINITY_DN11741_c0_g1_i1.p1 TRINITY_DN11741_c0_g1~~TRINITY_DN11741_c0_g1_i1.p1  ORF type:complete len:1170 (-),score=184.08 TRINITY_DN11741_c0_g1_i1:211-3363(-)